MDLAFEGTAVLVTGGSSGIGRATAVAYGREGARVAITYHSRKDAAEDVAEEIEAAGGTAYIAQLDLGDPETIASAVTSVVEHWGGLDAVVANAVDWGRPEGRTDKIETADPAWWTSIVRANLEGNMHLAQHVAAPLRRSAHGRLVLVSTDVAVRGIPGGAWAYGAAKAGLHGLAANLQHDLGADGVLVNVVVPGITLEDGAHRIIPPETLAEVTAGFTARHLPDVSELADAILYLTSPRTKSVQYQLLHITGGHLMPR